MKKRAKPLVKIALSDERNAIGSHAYQVLLLGLEDINRSVLADDYFQNTALELLVNPETPEFIIGRLASITLGLLINTPDIAQLACGYIFHFLRYTGNPTVFNMLETITGDPRAEKSQQWLIDMGYPEYVARELNNIDSAYKSTNPIPLLDPLYQKLLCLYQLVFKSATNPILAKGFRSKEIIQSVASGIEFPPDFIISAQWKAINSLCTQETSSMMHWLVPVALKYLSEPCTYLASFRVSSLDFIIAMMGYWTDIFKQLRNSGLLQNLTVLLLQFPEATILHASFRKFCEVAITDPEYAEKIVTIYSPIMMDVVHRWENKVLTPTCYEVMETFVEASKKNKAVDNALNMAPEYKDFKKTDMKNYNKLLTSSYGGFVSGKVLSVLRDLFAT